MSDPLDSNILRRSIEANHPQQGEARGLINQLVARDESVYLLPQVFYEFWVVATRPKGKENGLGLSAVEAAAILTKLASVFPIVHDTPEVFRQ